MINRPSKGDRAAKAVAQNDGTVRAQLRRSHHEGIGLRLKAADTGGHGVGIAKARPVEGDDAVTGAQLSGQPEGKVAQVARGAVDQHQVGAGALHRCVNLLPADAQQVAKRWMGVLGACLVAGGAPPGQPGKRQQNNGQADQNAHLLSP